MTIDQYYSLENTRTNLLNKDFMTEALKNIGSHKNRTLIYGISYYYDNPVYTHIYLHSGKIFKVIKTDDNKLIRMPVDSVYDIILFRCYYELSDYNFCKYILSMSMVTNLNFATIENDNVLYTIKTSNKKYYGEILEYHKTRAGDPDLLPESQKGLYE